MIAARRAPGASLLLVGAALLAVGYLLWHTGSLPRLPGGAAVPSTTAPAGTTTWLALEDGTIVRRSPSGEIIERIEASAFGHIYAKTATQLGWDSRRGLLWYSDSHQGIRSMNPASHETGPSLMSFADAALVGCATVSDGRPFAIDEARRRIIVPVGTGGMLIYDADDLAMTSTISAKALDSEPGFLPPLTVDDRRGAIWYAALDGSIVELDATHYRATGRRIPFARSPHDVRSLATRSGTLQILGTDGTMTTVDLRNLQPISAHRPVDDGLVVGVAAAR